MSRQKERQVNLRMSEVQRAAVAAAAEAEKVTLASYIRAAIDARLRSPGGLPVDAEFRRSLDAIRRHLRQADDGPAIRWAVLVAAELLEDPSGGSPVARPEPAL